MAEAAASGNAAEARGFEALSDANRREILRILSGGDKPVREIADAMTISRPAVSRHLRLLKDAGMVAEEAQGTRRVYHLQERGLEAVREYLERVWGEAAGRFRLLAENTRDGTGASQGGRETPGS
jgi:DNA-binding transcriptional ArsR family regulator